MREILYRLVYKMSLSFLKSKFWRKNKCNSNPFHNREYLENYSICLALKQLNKVAQGGPWPCPGSSRDWYCSTPCRKLCYVMRPNKNIQTIICITSEAGDAVEPERLVPGSAWLCDLGQVTQPLCASVLTPARELL